MDIHHAGMSSPADMSSFLLDYVPPGLIVSILGLFHSHLKFVDIHCVGARHIFFSRLRSHETNHFYPHFVSFTLAGWTFIIFFSRLCLHETKRFYSCFVSFTLAICGHSGIVSVLGISSFLLDCVHTRLIIFILALFYSHLQCGHSSCRRRRCSTQKLLKGVPP